MANKKFVSVFVWIVLGFCMITSPVAAMPDTLVVGDDGSYPPYSYLDDDGRPMGFHVDLMRAIAEEMDMPIQFNLGEWEVRREMLAKGRIDVLPMFYSPFRDLTFDFSDPHTIIYHEIFKRKEAPAIHDVRDLAGKRVALQEAAYVHDYLSNQNIKADMLLVRSEVEAMRAIIDGKADYALVSEHLGRRMLKEHSWDLTSTGSPILPVMYTFAVRNGNLELRDHLNAALIRLKEDGTFDELYDRWITSAGEPTNWPSQRLLRYSGFGLLIVMGIGLLGVGWIRILRKQVQTRTSELEESLHEKSLLLAEVNHRVKNNLAVIHGLLTIQRDKMTVAACEQELDDSLSRIKSMSLVHNFAYAQEDVSHIDMHSYVLRLLEELQAELDSGGTAISYDIDVEAVALSIDKAIPCGLILNEWLSNAIKHAFPDRKQGNVKLIVSGSDREVYISVSDDGVGLPDDLDPYQSKTTGFTIINLLVRQLKAEWSVEQENGTMVSLHFSTEPYESPA
jgi:two-component sensor histidine kinase/ABC-type amino acid transport substrate-binding protein